ncbi:MAG: hypothetical protein HGA85_06810 [Nanoarchaeota archaeon]|nr:hypothetical protein [Nanoarchaeota archaeon]
MHSRDSRYIAISLCTLFILSNLAWIMLDNRPLSAEDMIIQQQVNKIIYSTDKISTILELDYPFLVPAILSLFWPIFNHDTYLYVNLAFIPLLLGSIYILAEGERKKLGPIAIVVSLSFPPIIIMSRVLYDQFILIALYSLFLLMLVKSDWFRKPGYVAGATAVAVLCLFARYTIAPFLAASYLTAGYFSIRQGTEKKRLVNFAVSLAITIIAACAYYLTHPFMFFAYTQPATTTLAFSAESVFLAFKHIILNQAGIANFILLTSSFIVCIYLRMPCLSQKSSFFLASALLPQVFFIIFPYKSWLPTTAGLIPLAILMAILISKLNQYAWLLPLTFALMFLMPLPAESYISHRTYNEGQYIGGVCLLKVCRLHILPFRTESFYQHLTPLVVDESDEQVSDLLDSIEPESSVLFLIQDRYLHPHVLKHYSEVNRKRLYPASIYMAHEFPEEIIPESPANYSWIRRFDHIIAPSNGFISSKKEGRYAMLYDIIDSEEFKEGYVPEKSYVLRDYRLPEFTWKDGSKGIILYRRKSAQEPRQPSLP